MSDRRAGPPMWAGIVAIGGVLAVCFVCAAMVGVFTVLGGSALLIGALFANREATDLPVPQIEAIARVRIPDSATEIASIAGGGVDAFVLARFTLPAEDLPLFLNGTPHTPALTETRLPPDFARPYGLKPEWWTPERAQRVRYGARSHERVFLAVAVDETTPNQVIVYIAANER
ncbi:MAG: hypothetical protein NZ518_00150 [Dehalococcoidia bacterium]|nr:hypothetical protein [Dehalococcoidia bacterium]